MTYRHSDLDRSNLSWFQNDASCASLFEIRVAGGEIRGLKDLTVRMEYPITAFAGCNGSGKTTLLALAACAFHSPSSGWCPPGRTVPYYTFSDFFIQTADEMEPAGIVIYYGILHNNWRKSRQLPTGVGRAHQLRKKRTGGRWTNYDRRVRRPVVYLGIHRVVPHAEKSVSKAYRKSFLSGPKQGWESKACAIVGRILQKPYANLEYRTHSSYPEKHRLAFAECGGAKYSGFNMGAGEDALFGLISTLLSCPERTLVLVDELELGLHEDAQARLVGEMKQLCGDRHLQVICTTHSARILEALPPEGRIYLERVADRTLVMPGVSSEFATGRLSGRNRMELDILVEDEVSKQIVEAALPSALRARVGVLPVGSATSVMIHLATRYKEPGSKNACVLLDGDKRQSEAEQIKAFLSIVESENSRPAAREWAKKRLGFLSGTSAPEIWLVSQRSAAMLNYLEKTIGTQPGTAQGALAVAALADAHDIVHELAQALSVANEAVLLNALARGAFEAQPQEAGRLCGFVEAQLV